ncbi:hypothetical protein B0H66DRAFT_170482 [Apodospora peruviana]|uniref:NACHT domain-containing protein n=1 Tax=Apodospora peruviana TaxID=516989 RepID=A0AAE0MBW1_9PEZI|nr:hypothetical protein B0H66DRAFT_170482 [Apodospora peruviana]
MEPLAAFGLACNVMQLIHFTGETASLCKKVFRTGFPDPGLARYVEDSAQLHTHITQWMVEAQQPLNEEENELLQIAEKTKEASNNLKREVDRLTRPSAKGKKFASVVGAVKAKIRENKVEKVERRMHDYQRILESRLLFRVCKTTNALQLRQDDRFTSLNDGLQNFIRAYSEGHTRLEELIDKHSSSVKDVVRAETLKSQHNITATVLSESSKNRHETSAVLKQLSSEARRERLLRSLKYDMMGDRFGQIPPPHEGTYQWIMRGIAYWIEGNEDPADETLTSRELQSGCPHDVAALDISWKCFPCWLESKSPTDKIYWIQGKAGSGKSTLMKFVVEDDRLWSDLKSAEQDPLILSHFLWSAGAYMQKSVRGILLALLFQFLSSNESLLDEVVNEFPQTKFKDIPGDWSVEELEKVIHASFVKSPKPIFVFLDGLDEISTCDVDNIDTPANLLRVVTNLSMIGNVKVCVSSRPEPVFKNQLKSISSLQLQDLTLLDMKMYAEASLLQAQPDLRTRTEFNGFVDEILSKADGVFLWTALVVKSLSRGLANGDRIDELLRRLHQMPKGLHALYQNMWSRLNDDESIYREEAALYFNMTLEWLRMRSRNYRQPINIFHVMAATQPSRAKAILKDYTAFSAEELELACQETAKGVETRTAGLLEVVWGKPRESNRVEFVHRSALEFFENTPDGQQILRYDQNPLSTTRKNLLDAFLAELWVGVTNHYDPGMSNHTICAVMERINHVWDQGQIRQDEALELFLSCKKLYEIGNWNDKTHEYGIPINFPNLDFAGIAAIYGIHRLVYCIIRGEMPGCRTEPLLPRYRAYLLVAALAEAQVLSFHDQDIEVKRKVISMLRETHPFVDDGAPSPSVYSMTPSPTAQDVNTIVFLATLTSRLVGDNDIINLPNIFKDYVGNRISLDEKVAVMFEYDRNSRTWTIECVDERHTYGWRQHHRWVVIAMNVSFLAELVLLGLASNHDSATIASKVSKAQSTLDELRRETRFTARYSKVLAFSMITPSYGNQTVTFKVPAIQEDADAIISCITNICAIDTQILDTADYDARVFELPGLRDCLEGIDSRSQEVDEETYKRAVLDNHKQKLVADFMGHPPMPYVN